MTSRKLAKILAVSIAFMVASALFSALLKVASGKNGTGEPNLQISSSDLSENLPRPMIIWNHNIHRDSPSALKTALSSGLISTVIIKTVHPKDFVKKEFTRTKTAVGEAINIAKEYKIKIIWSRPLWPLYSIEHSNPDDLFDPEYYITEIRNIRTEAKEIGADFAALDVETYGYSPLKKLLTGGDKLNSEQIALLRDVVEKVVHTIGQVDFIYPAGLRNRPKHAYNILRELGKYKICEDTFWSVEERLKSIGYPYDIFGAYINTERQNRTNPKLPYFLLPEIFDKSELWSDKKGVLLYPRENQALEIANQLVAYSKRLPHKSNFKTTDSNSVKQ